MKKKNNTYPFLSVRVSQIIDGLGIPMLPDAEEFQREESVLSHDHEVHEEASSGLDHTDLAVCHRNQPAHTILVSTELTELLVLSNL